MPPGYSAGRWKRISNDTSLAAYLQIGVRHVPRRWVKMAQHVYNLLRQRQHFSFFLCQNFEKSLLCLPFFVY
jgi:hypothetical protein